MAKRSSEKSAKKDHGFVSDPGNCHVGPDGRGWVNGNAKPNIHVPGIGVEHNVKTTLWYERKGETPPPGTPKPGTVEPSNESD